MLSPLHRLRWPIPLRREAVTLVFLCGLSIVLFIGVTALSQLFHAQQGALSDRWAARGQQDLSNSRFAAAADDFHAALRYSHDSYSQQLGLAEALIGMKRIDEADVYLVNLWQQEPENGIVNRELARIAAGKGDRVRALRYYHNAIYAIWPGAEEKERLNTRWELIKYLLSIQSTTDAQSELIALGAEVGDSPSQQAHLGSYFLRVQDGPHALAAFRIALKAEPHDPNLLAGAGEAAFTQGDYTQAHHYFSGVLARRPGDSEATARQNLINAVLSMDPFRRDNSDAERVRALQTDLGVAGQRLASCPAIASLPSATQPSQTLQAAYTKLKAGATAGSLRRDSELGTAIMELLFEVEHQANTRCGAGSTADQAILLISKLHEGS